jgi:hypothetical protein
LAAGHPFAPRSFEDMVIYDRDRTRSIKETTTPPADGGQTQNDPRPVTSEPAHVALPAASGVGHVGEAAAARTVGGLPGHAGDAVALAPGVGGPEVDVPANRPRCSGSGPPGD